VTATADDWLEGWDRQQEAYIPGRNRRFELIAAIAGRVGGPRARVLDLGCGPGSLLTRLHGSLPEALLVGLDNDPVLLAVARTLTDVSSRTALLDCDLHNPGWPVVAGHHGPFDVVVSSTALHWLPEKRVRETYRAITRLLRPGGWFLNGDTMPLDASDQIDSVLEELHRPHEDSSPWAEWWRQLEASGSYRRELEERRRRRAAAPPTADFMPSAEWHLAALASSGFPEVAVVWRDGHEAVVAGRRPDTSNPTFQPKNHVCLT
jgi:SAM-dependent methyltransferase